MFDSNLVSRSADRPPVWFEVVFYAVLFGGVLVLAGAITLVVLHFDPSAKAATATAPCIAMPDAANHARYDFSQWTCPVVGSHHFLEVRLVHYRGKVIGMRVLKLVP